MSEQQREQIATILARAIRQKLDKQASTETKKDTPQTQAPEVVDES
ncbi:hypothetical protein LF1_05670 [Rubripirellula obstinata]|uniref:Uncharacterized protein n=1 Tax=Rubripirellula obstinata TaxID=406547 RepID=A0A5B1CCW2_9BACT|nr:hypothetical protein [Rubripirellula obstinata]KAA1258052.1 hypothetical protein LF1_05670 [Rubripirellula obstinata]